MPVFHFDFHTSVARIDLAPERSGIFTPSVSSIELHDAEMDRFNALVRRFAPEQPPLTLDQIAGAARRVLRAAHKGEPSAFIAVRMRRAGELRAALADPDWETAPALARDARDLIDYIDAGVGLIPNDIPHVGLLDDAILIDAAMDKLRGELDDYADFCRYRSAEAASRRVAPDALRVTRAEWFEARRQEHRLEQQLRRVRSSRYAAAGGADRTFRVC